MHLHFWPLKMGWMGLIIFTQLYDSLCSQMEENFQRECSHKDNVCTVLETNFASQCLLLSFFEENFSC